MPAMTCSELLTSCATDGRTMPVVVIRLMYARSAVENARSVVTVGVGSVWVGHGRWPTQVRTQAGRATRRLHNRSIARPGTGRNS